MTRRILELCFAVVGGLLLVVLYTSNSVASVEKKARSFVLCKNQKNIRTIRITSDEKEHDGCIITYSKSGIDEIVGGSHSMSSCKTVLKNIQTNLETSHWACRSVESARITYGSEALE